MKTRKEKERKEEEKDLGKLARVAKQQGKYYLTIRRL